MDIEKTDQPSVINDIHTKGNEPGSYLSIFPLRQGVAWDNLSESKFEKGRNNAQDRKFFSNSCGLPV